MRTIYIKVPVSERLPKDKGDYYTNDNELYYDGKDWWFSDTKSYPRWWLQEIELPSENEIANKIEELQEKYYESQATHGDFYLMGEACIEYILNKITNTK